MMDSSSSISNINTYINNNNNTDNSNSSNTSSISKFNARRLDKRSKSLASASTIIDGVHSVMTSTPRSSSKTSRPSLAFRALPTTTTTTDQNDFHSSIVKSIQPNFNVPIAKPSTTDMRFLYSITSVSKLPSQSEASKTSKLEKSASILANSCNNNNNEKNGRGAPISPTSPNATNANSNSTSVQQQQQPTINIISNPNFEQEPMEVTSDLNENNGLSNNPSSSSSSSSSDTNNNNNSDTTTAKAKTKRNTSSLSSSLRHLITITFNRGSSSGSNNSNNNNTNAKASQSSKSNSGRCDRKSSSQKRNLLNKQSKLSKDSINSTNSILISQQQQQQHQTKQPMESSMKEDHNKRSSLSQNISHGGDETSNSSRRQTTFSDKDKTSKETFSSHQQQQNWSSPTNADVAEIDGKTYIECPLCVLLVSESSTPHLEGCRHRVCLECMQRYITTEINHSRLNITCPICSEPIHPNTIKTILQNEKYYLKYESFMLRRVLAAEPDARWCPAPDCGYVVLANGCASCPKLVCGREGCNTSFCYHCKQEWHPNQTCSAASIQRNKRIINAYNIGDLIEESTQTQSNRKSSKSSLKTTSIRVDDIKECPVCASRIIKMNDGSCNHMKCSICETEFCWLCMKEISDLHYFSPSGCTFWGKKPWSRKKKFLWHLGMLVGAPICIILIAGIAVPAIVIGIPVWAARKLHNRLERKPFSRYRKNAIITGGVLLSFVVSPIISAVALAIGIPILLGYVYGVVPLSLCRSSGGCLSPAPSLENLQHEFQAARHQSNSQARDGISIDTAMSHRLGDPSIGETSLYMSNISLETNSIGHVTTVDRDRESASNAALAGSIISATADDGNSTRALAGSIISKESGYTLIPAEVHNSAVLGAVAAANQSMADQANQSKSSVIRTK